MKKILEVKQLKKYFQQGKETSLKAVDGISFDVYEGETLGLVGESGCGKSTTGRTIVRLYKPTEGGVLFNGRDIHQQLKPKETKEINQKMQMVFQDPYASLNPRMTVGDIIAEGIDIHGLYKGKDRKDKVSELLETVGLNHEHANRYAHEFSGGQRQRIGIARALAVEPEFVVADEPISALDVSVQAQIVNLLMDLQKEKKLTFLFISHDLSMVKYISDRIGVMYLGNLVELAPSNALYKDPLHPYTSMLMEAIPNADASDNLKRHGKHVSRGELPSPLNPPSGCVYRTRCPLAKRECSESKPEWKEVHSNHFVACHLY